MTTPSPTYQPGDQLQVTADEPYSTELHKGDLVTVVQPAVKILDGVEVPVVVVMTALGTRWLGLDAVEPYDSAHYTPGEPDEVIDAFLERMVRSDLELHTIFIDAERDLATGKPHDRGAGAEKADHEPPPSPPVASVKQPTSPHPHGDGVWNKPDGKCEFRIRDFYGDVLHIQYAEIECPDHGREGTFFFSVNQGTPVMLPVQFVQGFIGWLATRAQFYERPAEE